MVQADIEVVPATCVENLSAQRVLDPQWSENFFYWNCQILPNLQEEVSHAVVGPYLVLLMPRMGQKNWPQKEDSVHDRK